MSWSPQIHGTNSGTVLYYQRAFWHWKTNGSLYQKKMPPLVEWIERIWPSVFNEREIPFGFATSSTALDQTIPNWQYWQDTVVMLCAAYQLSVYRKERGYLAWPGKPEVQDILFYAGVYRGTHRLLLFLPLMSLICSSVSHILPWWFLGPK